VLAVVETPIGQRLRVAVPAELGAGAHRLAVRVGDEKVVADGAVLRGERRADQILVLDRSQSMATPVGLPTPTGAATRFAIARRAAQAFVDAAPDGTQLGLVAFAGNGSEPNDDAVEALDLAPLDTMQRSAFAAALGALAPPSGPTSIGDGLAAAARSFLADGAANQERHAILLSDGAESEPSSWPTVRSAVLASDMRVHAIALGSDADQGLLAEIAAETQGSFEFVPESPAGTLQTRLDAAFLRAADRSNARQRFFETQQRLETGTPVSIPIPIEAAADGSATIAVHWDDPAAAVEAELRDPSGAVRTGTQAHADVSWIQQIAIDGAGDSGVWQLRINALGGSPTVSVSGSGDRFDGKYLVTGATHNFDAPPVGRTGGSAAALPVAIGAALVGPSGPITGAVGEAEVEHPDGTTETLLLADDGRGDDAAADDGVYTATFRRTTAWSATGLPETVPGTRGSYRVAVRFPRLPGALPDDGRFDAFSFWVGLGDANDGDGDGLFDRYEEIHDCLAGTAAAADPDGDRLSSTEEHLAGTDPCESDTDEGGENDGSELARGGNPIDPRDDLLPAPGFFSLVTRINELHVPQDPRYVPQPSSNLLRVPAAKEYALLLIERRETAGGTSLPWTERARVDPRTLGGVWLDAGLVPGLAFEYRMRGIDASGNESAVSRTVSGVVKLDPLAPIGALRIPGNRRTDDPQIDVAIDLYGEEDPAAIQMRVGAAHGRGSFETYRATKTIDVPAPAEPTPMLVLATLRDAAGNESLPYAEEIVVHPRNSLGDVRASIERPEGASPAGVVVRLAGLPGEPFAVSGKDGAVALTDLLPGVYTVEFVEPDGSVAVSLPTVVLGGGATDLGTVSVPEPDAIAGAIAALVALGIRARTVGRSRAARRPA
jgi:Mg-chelatase subunit ChlD